MSELAGIAGVSAFLFYATSQQSSATEKSAKPTKVVVPPKGIEKDALQQEDPLESLNEISDVGSPNDPKPAKEEVAPVVQEPVKEEVPEPVAEEPVVAESAVQEAEFVEVERIAPEIIIEDATVEEIIEEPVAEQVVEAVVEPEVVEVIEEVVAEPEIIAEDSPIIEESAEVSVSEPAVEAASEQEVAAQDEAVNVEVLVEAPIVESTEVPNAQPDPVPEAPVEPVPEAEPIQEPLAEAEPVVDAPVVEPEVEAEPVVQAEPVVKAEAVVVSEPLVKAEQVPEPVAESTPVPEPVVEAVSVPESEPVVEAEPIVEAEPLPETEQVVEAQSIVVTEPEPVVEVEPVVAEQASEQAAVASEPIQEPAEVATQTEPDANVDPIVAEAGSAVEVDPVTDEIIPLVEEQTPVKKVFPEVPPEVEYLIVGGGTAAYSAVRAIRKYDPTAKILIVSDEPEMPYNRTPLSKELWFETEENAALGKYKGWDDKERVIFHEKLENYCTGRDLQEREGYGGTALLLGAKVDRLDADRKKAVLYNGTEIGYEKVLLSIGGKPKNLPEFKNVSEKVTLFRDLKDFRQLSEISHKGGDVVVVGSGFLGTELSYALAERAKKVENLNVSQICREQGVLGAVLPEHLSNFSSEVLEKEGVNIIRNAEIAGVSEDSDKLSINLKDGRSVPADHVVLAVGVDIDHGLAERSGLEVDSNRGGFIVNSELESRKDIFVAGDAANFYDQRLGRRRVEHYDHAIVTGRLAGENMVGMRKAYTHQSMFWSDIGADNGFEAIGLVDSKLKSVSVFAQPEEQNTEGGNFNERKFDKGVVFYLRNENVVGVVTWNIFGKMGVARRLLAHKSEELDFAEMARLFNVHK